MADVHTPEIRSKNMAAIHSADTRPELIIRRYLHAKGYRYRLHVKKMPGNPDMVFRKHSAVIFIHGCFWHRHNCQLFQWPKTRVDFWSKKLNQNADRDQRNTELLSKEWRVGVIWECALRGRGRLDIQDVVSRISDWLSSDIRNAIVTGNAQVT